MAQLIDPDGNNEEIETAISALAGAQRERAIAEARESGAERPAPFDAPFDDWEGGGGPACAPAQDLV
eukprot:9370327-Pyramimonas_sp.AAC.1